MSDGSSLMPTSSRCYSRSLSSSMPSQRLTEGDNSRYLPQSTRDFNRSALLHPRPRAQSASHDGAMPHNRDLSSPAHSRRRRFTPILKACAAIFSRDCPPDFEKNRRRSALPRWPCHQLARGGLLRLRRSQPAAGNFANSAADLRGDPRNFLRPARRGPHG